MVRVNTSVATKQGIQNATYTYAPDAQASDSYAITLDPAPSAYATGQSFMFKANTANTGASSLNVNGLGAITLKKQHDQDTATGDIEAGSIVEVVYDGTNFQIISILASASGIASLVEDTSPQLGGTLDTNSNQVQWSKGADVASANALTLGTDGNYFDITGTTAITSIGTLKIGTVVKLHFDGALTLTHHATDLILPGGANITTSAGDEAEFVEYATGDWRCTNYTKADGTAVVSSGGAVERYTYSHTFDAISTTIYNLTQNVGATVTANTVGAYLQTNSGNTAVAKIGKNELPTTSFNFWDLSPSFGVMVQNITSANGTGWQAFGIGSSSNTLAPTDGWDKRMWFVRHTVSDTTTWYACISSGGAEANVTATDITSSVPATDRGYFSAKLTSGTSAKFYINGTLVATIATTLPSGTATDANSIRAEVVNASGDTTQRRLNLSGFSVSFNFASA